MTRCLFPTPAGRCHRHVKRAGDHCYQHGGRYVPDLVRRFLEGESMREIAFTLSGGFTLEQRVTYVEERIRRFL